MVGQDVIEPPGAIRARLRSVGPVEASERGEARLGRGQLPEPDPHAVADLPHAGTHYISEDSAAEIGAALADWYATT